jgi:hypothetical protein
MEPRKKKRKSAWDHDPAKVAAAEALLRESKNLQRDPDRLLRILAGGGTVRLPLRSDLGVIASVFEAVHRGDYAGLPVQPDVETLRRLLLFCREQTDLLSDQDAPRYANALLALAAHHRDWVRPLEDWRVGTHNASRQFRSLLGHLIARYEVPTFLEAAWMEGLTAEGIRHQGWYKLVAGGRNIRTATDLPVPLTKRQAHHFLLAPDDFDIPSAFRWAIILDMGGDERLVRSILGTPVGTAFDAEEFWTSVFRFFVAHPLLDPAHHGPIIDYLRHQKFLASVPNPHADRPGQAPLLPPHPHLSMKGRTPDSLLRAIRDWHRSLAQGRASTPATWAASGIPPLAFAEGSGEDEQFFEVVELLGSTELVAEGRAMNHCVASYAASCVSGRTSIWSLRKRIESGRMIRMVTIEVDTRKRTIVQARRRWNKPPNEAEWSILERWADAGGLTVSYWLAR